VISAILSKLRDAIAGRPRAAREGDGKNETVRMGSIYESIPEYIWAELIAKKYTANELYGYLNGYYKYRAPEVIREHRSYFQIDKRGFGEDAFHAMWWLLFLELRPINCLEIGVYRGQVISLWALISKVINLGSDIWGISPLEQGNDSVSTYLNGLNYEADINANFSTFGLPPPQLLRAYSTDAIAKQFVGSRKWDLIYIDGSHDLEIVLEDYRNSLENLRPGGILVFDDAALQFDYSPGQGSFAGHPGPSTVARQYAAIEMELVGVVGHNVLFKKPSS